MTAGRWFVLIRLFIAELIRRGLDDEPDQGHEWDADPGEWVRRQRADQRRTG